MTRQAILAVVVAAMLATAGCASQVNPSDGGGEGTVTMYISDQPNAIDDFEHLNVTVTEVGLHRVDDPDTEANESGWVRKDIDNVTVDLTELQGENASQLGAASAPNGTYDKVFIHVSEVEGTLKDGSNPTVKLPSSKLHVNKNFTVGNGETVDFVFDVGVQKAGGSGMYIIKPVVSQSGTDVEINQKASAKVESAGEQGTQSGDETETSTDASLDFYVSDERNAIGDFAHLNVTITKVGAHRVNGTWVEKDVGNATVDLTELQGANATKLGTLDVPNGTYDKTFVYVSEVNGTLKSGEEVDVKLPSSKLHVNKNFTVGNGETVDFVFDITVFKAGNSGKYILKPVVSQSGTGEQVDIEEKEDENDDAEEQTEGEQNETETAAALDVSLQGNATAGENVTVVVTRNGSAVANATVRVNGEVAGETGADGTLVVAVPADAEELEIEVAKGDAEGELTTEVAAGGDGNSALAPPPL